jgi:hypothetical protein
MISAAIAFFTKGVGRYIAAAFIGAALVSGIYSAGYLAASRSGQATRYKQERDNALRDLRLAEGAAITARLLISDANRRSMEARKRAEEYEKSLSKSGKCGLTDDDIRELRNIRRR